MKNPFLSAWLSAAHTVLNQGRSHAVQAARRQQGQLVAQATRQVMDFWAGALLPVAVPKAKGGKPGGRRKRSSSR